MDNEKFMWQGEPEIAGIVAHTLDGRVVYVNSMVSGDIENVMHALGYGSRDFWLGYGYTKEGKPAEYKEKSIDSYFNDKRSSG